MEYSKEKDEIINYLKKNGINSLWHFTDIRNIEYIEKFGGLRSKEFLEQKDLIDSIFCGGNSLSHDLDKGLGNWNKISLNFTPHTPMAYHKKRETHLIFIEIDLEVASFQDVYFTNCNATRIINGQKRDKGLRGLKHVNFSIINGPAKPWDPDWKKFVQAEILVPNFIPTDYFKTIYFISEASMELSEKYFKEKKYLLKIEKSIFEDSGSIQFSYVNNLYISLDKITEENVSQVSESVSYLQYGKEFWVIVDLFSNSGLLWSINLTGNYFNKKEENIFEKENSWFWFPNFVCPDEKYLNIEVYCEDILWAKKILKVIK